MSFGNIPSIYISYSRFLIPHKYLPNWSSRISFVYIIYIFYFCFFFWYSNRPYPCDRECRNDVISNGIIIACIHRIKSEQQRTSSNDYLSIVPIAIFAPFSHQPMLLIINYKQWILLHILQILVEKFKFQIFISGQTNGNLNIKHVRINLFF